MNETTFALAQEQLEKNKHHSPRRTIDPILLGGMLVCQQCGYALYRVSTHTSKHKLNYYRCIGSDGYRHFKGPVCRNRPIRQDYLDEFVWKEVVRLLDDPALIQCEIDRRMEAARKADPFRKREQSLRQQHTRLENHMARLVTAYQEELINVGRVAATHTEFAQATTDSRIAAALYRDSVGGSVHILATCRNTFRVSWETSLPSRDTGCDRAAENRSVGRPRNSGRQ